MILNIKEKEKKTGRLIKKFVFWRRISPTTVVIFQKIWIEQVRVEFIGILPIPISYYADVFYYLNKEDMPSIDKSRF